MAEMDLSSPSTGGKSQLRELLSRFPRYPMRSWGVFLAFLGFVVVRYVQIGARMDFLAAIRFEFLLGIVVILLVGTQLAQRKPEIGKSKPILIAIVLLFGAMILELPLAADPTLARQIFMDRVIKFALLTFFMVVMIESPNFLRWFLAAFLFSIYYITLESVQGLISGGLVWQNQGTMRLHGAVSIYEHPNSLGGVAMGALPFCAFLFPRARNIFLKLGLLALAGTSLICVVYSGSRTAYIGLLVFILWWFFQIENKKRFLIWGVLVGTIGISILPDQYIERFESITGEEKESHSKDARIEILKDAWTILLENPLGVGVASFPAVRFVRFNRFQDTHNLYLEVGTNLGWHGLVVFLFLVYAMLAEFRRSAFAFKAQVNQLIGVCQGVELSPKVRRSILAHIRDLRFLRATAQATGGFIVTRLALGMFGMDLYEVYWWFGAGIAIVLAGLVVSTNRNTRALVRTIRT